MSNFHCIPNTCSQIVYQEYLAPVVRWRYSEDEEWQEIEGDDYSLDRSGDCQGLAHHLVYSRANVQGSKRECYLTGTFDSFSPASGWQGNRNAPFTNLRLIRTESNETFHFDSYEDVAEFMHFGCPSTRYQFWVTDNTGVDREVINTGNRGIRLDYFGVVPNQKHLCKEQCKFTVYRNKKVVYTEDRKTCPEVEKLPCRLSDEYKLIKIEKEAYLQRIEVRDQSIEVVYVSPLNAPLIEANALPPECLNIYNTYTLAPPFLSNFVPISGAFNPYKFVKQICSAPGCPPPKYQVLCNCDCKSCPDGTCPVGCGNHVCCYDPTTGKSIEEILKVLYCGK